MADYDKSVKVGCMAPWTVLGVLSRRPVPCQVDGIPRYVLGHSLYCITLRTYECGLIALAVVLFVLSVFALFLPCHHFAGSPAGHNMSYRKSKFSYLAVSGLGLVPAHITFFFRFLFGKEDMFALFGF